MFRLLPRLLISRMCILRTFHFLLIMIVVLRNITTFNRGSYFYP